MTKFSYDLVSLYYRGRSPLKKEDNSFFMCLYTMLVILFILVCLLILTILLRFGKIEEEHQDTKHTEAYHLQNKLHTTVKAALTATTLSDSDSQTEESHLEEPVQNLLDWEKLMEFLTGEEETTVTETSASTVYTETSSLEQINHDDKHYDSFSPSFIATKNTKLSSLKYREKSEQPLYNTTGHPETSSLEQIQNSEKPYDDTYLFGDPENNLKWKNEDDDRALENETFIFKNAGTCDTSNCLMTASRMIASMNVLAKPCHDFYKFSCGAVSVETKENVDNFVPNSMSGEKSTNFLRTFHMFFESCSHHEDHFDYEIRIQQTKNLLNDLGILQFDRNNVNQKADLTQVLSTLILFDVMPLFDVGIDVDPNSSKYTISFAPPDKRSSNTNEWSPFIKTQRKCLRKIQENMQTSPINITSLYNVYQMCKNNFSDYLTSFETPIKELGNFGNMTRAEITDYTKHITEFLGAQMFSKINEIPVLDRLMCIMENRYEVMSVKELESEYSVIDWRKLLRLLSSADIDNKTSIHICNRAYFKSVFRNWLHSDSEDVVDAFSAILAHHFFHSTILPIHRNSRMLYCKERTRKLMPNIAKYLQKKIISVKDFNQMKHNMTNIFNNIKRQFDNFLTNLEWSKKRTISYIMKQISEIQLKMFAVEDVDSEEIFLDKVYHTLKLEKDNYIYNYFNIMRFRKLSILSIHGQSLTEEITFRNIIDTDEKQPVLFHGINFIYLPYGFINKVSVDLPWYINIAKVGFPLAKSLVHLLEPMAIEHDTGFDENNLLNLIHNITKDTDLLPDHLNFGNQEIIFTLNDELSRRERIADNIALNVLSLSVDNVQNYPLLPWISYEYSREKIFFLALVQELCQDMPLVRFMLDAHENPILPSLLRIEIMFRNSESFLTQFGCRPR